MYDEPKKVVKKGEVMVAENVAVKVQTHSLNCGDQRWNRWK